MAPSRRSNLATREKPGRLAGRGKAEPVPAASAEGAAFLKSLTKGLAVLDMLLESGIVRTTDVAAELGIDKGASSRILQTLVQAGYADHASSRRYALGRKLKAHLVSGRDTANFKEQVRPILQRLADGTGESAHLGVLVDNQVLYIDRVDTALPLRVDRPVGTLAPLHCTALGKIFLAYGLAQVPQLLPPFTIRTVTSTEMQQAQRQQILSRGYAIDDEEFYSGIRCVAAPLRDADGTVVAAIGVSGPTARIDLAKLEKFGVLIAKIAGSFKFAESP